MNDAVGGRQQKAFNTERIAARETGDATPPMKQPTMVSLPSHTQERRTMRADAGTPSPGDGTPRPTIASTLAGLVAVCLVPSVLALAWMLTLDYRAQQKLLASEVLTRATTMRLYLDGDLAKTEAGLQLLALSNDLAANDFARFRERLVDAKRMQRVEGYVLVDTDGRVRVDTRNRYGRSAARDAVATTTQPVFAAGAPALSGLVSAGEGIPPVVNLTVPIPRGDRTAYALVAALSPAAIIAATRADLPDGWIASVVDRDGRIIARSRDSARFVGEQATPSLLAAMESRSKGEAEAVTKDGVVVVTAFDRSELGGWTVVVGAPKASLDAGLYKSVAILAAVVVVAFALVLWFALRVSRRVSRAVGDLVEPARALGNGRPIERPPTALRETDAVGRAMHEASRRLATAQHHAYHDPLTNLRNRTLFDEMATRQIAQAYRDGAQLAILAIDLDGFKAVNDLHGHAAGDAVLKAVADRITGLLRGSDVVSRRGGDEFSVLLVDVDGARTRQVAEKILGALSQPYADVAPEVSASIGVARYPRDATTLTALLEHADEALYAAKNAGKRRVVGDF